MLTAQTSEGRKEEFKTYLEKSGVVDQLTKALVTLFEEPEKPNNPVDFLKGKMDSQSRDDFEALQEEHDRLK